MIVGRVLSAISTPTESRTCYDTAAAPESPLPTAVATAARSTITEQVVQLVAFPSAVPELISDIGNP